MRCWPPKFVARSILAGLLAGFASASHAGGGPLGIDHMWNYDDSGIWNRKYQQALEYGLIGAEVIGALWEGGETRLGRTFWQSIDASASAGVVSEVAKRAFSRVRPIGTHFVLEYGGDHPWVYGLEALPVYDAIARLKLQAHWQTDVLAGFALGTAAGWFMHRNPDSPYVLRIMPHSVYVGLSKKF